MDKTDLLARMQAAHVQLEELLSGLTDGQESTPGVYGESSEMTVKDVLAHIAAWERMEAGWLRASLLGRPVARFTSEFEISPDAQSDGHDEAMHALNAHIYEENKDRSFDEVLSSYRAAYGDLLSVVHSMSDATLNNPNEFDWWPGEPIWQSIEGNSYSHIEEHVALIHKWLAEDRKI